jgi:nicotinamidase-related amidase
MPTPFLPRDSALLLIDHQLGTMQLIRNIPVAHARKMTIALAHAAKILELPVVLTSSQEERLQGPLLPELQSLFPNEYAARVKRAGVVDAWQDAAFRKAVEATGKKNLIMAGVTTDVCLIYPSIRAVEDGYRVQAVMDASGSPFDMSEDLTRRRMEKAGVVLTTTNTMIAELAQDWSTPAGSQLIQLLFTEVLPPVLPGSPA